MAASLPEAARSKRPAAQLEVRAMHLPADKICRPWPDGCDARYSRDALDVREALDANLFAPKRLEGHPLREPYGPRHHSCALPQSGDEPVSEHGGCHLPLKGRRDGQHSSQSKPKRPATPFSWGHGDGQVVPLQPVAPVERAKSCSACPGKIGKNKTGQLPNRVLTFNSCRIYIKPAPYFFGAFANRK